MFKISLTVITLIILFLLTVISGVFYVVPEGKQVIITEFGKPIGEAITEAGLKVKTPFIQKAHFFEKRNLEWDGSPNQIPTKDKRFIWLDTSARWKITDALKFYQSLGTEEFAQSRLDDIIDSAARDLITGQLLIEVVRNSNEILETSTETITEEEGERLNEPLEEINIGRERITTLIFDQVQETLPQFGIELVDIRIKRINYVDEVKEKVYTRMISERQRISEKYKSEGEGEAANIMGQKLKELEKIQSEAYKEAERIRGEADAEAIRIYANAHEKDPEFYAFIKALETYKDTIGVKTTVLLSTDSDLYKYLKEIKAK